MNANTWWVVKNEWKKKKKRKKEEEKENTCLAGKQERVKESVIECI